MKNILTRESSILSNEKDKEMASEKIDLSRSPVADTNVLVAFSVVGRMQLLREIFPLLVIPAAVRTELVEQGMEWVEADLARNAVLEGGWIRVVSLSEHGIVGPPNLRLDPGESEVIALAHAWNALALLDEVPARRVAKSLEIRMIGSLGILRTARERGHIEEVAPIVREMRGGGIRFGDELVERFLAELGEV